MGEAAFPNLWTCCSVIQKHTYLDKKACLDQRKAWPFLWDLPRERLCHLFCVWGFGILYTVYHGQQCIFTQDFVLSLDSGPAPLSMLISALILCLYSCLQTSTDECVAFLRAEHKQARFFLLHILISHLLANARICNLPSPLFCSQSLIKLSWVPFCWISFLHSFITEIKNLKRNSKFPVTLSQCSIP